jgi:hypothetical protein
MSEGCRVCANICHRIFISGVPLRTSTKKIPSDAFDGMEDSALIRLMLDRGLFSPAALVE